MQNATVILCILWYKQIVSAHFVQDALHDGIFDENFRKKYASESEYLMRTAFREIDSLKSTFGKSTFFMSVKVDLFLFTRQLAVSRRVVTVRPKRCKNIICELGCLK